MSESMLDLRPLIEEGVELGFVLRVPDDTGSGPDLFFQAAADRYGVMIALHTIDPGDKAFIIASAPIVCVDYEAKRVQLQIWDIGASTSDEATRSASIAEDITASPLATPERWATMRERTDGQSPNDALDSVTYTERIGGFVHRVPDERGEGPDLFIEVRPEPRGVAITLHTINPMDQQPRVPFAPVIRVEYARRSLAVLQRDTSVFPRSPLTHALIISRDVASDHLGQNTATYKQQLKHKPQDG